MSQSTVLDPPINEVAQGLVVIKHKPCLGASKRTRESEFTANGVGMMIRINVDAVKCTQVSTRKNVL